MQWALDHVLSGRDGREAYRVMCAYRDGSHGYPHSRVMAYSWAHVLLTWFQQAEEPEADPLYGEARELIHVAGPQLSPAEVVAAMRLALEALGIALTHGAPWLQPS